jgi:hypothetical protein
MNTENKPSRGYPIAGDRRIWPKGREPGDILNTYPGIMAKVEWSAVDPSAQRDSRWQNIVPQVRDAKV